MQWLLGVLAPLLMALLLGESASPCGGTLVAQRSGGHRLSAQFAAFRSTPLGLRIPHSTPWICQQTWITGRLGS